MLRWPPTIVVLLKEERTPPSAVQTFYKYLSNAHHNKERPPNSINMVLSSFMADMIHAFSKGETFSFSLRLTGGRHLMDLVRRLDHYLNHNLTYEI